jgi:glycosyltransferase involved in cell wall biosynthesis
VVKVSIITPTYERHHFHARLRDCVLAQTCDDIEWLVLDDSTCRLQS